MLQKYTVGLMISLAFALMTIQVAAAGAFDKALVAASGYDVVSYHEKSGPMQGAGWHTSEHDGVVYLFASKKNKKTFDNSPDKYVPAYGGYCAYGVAVGKKFYTDPLSYHIENERLYLNLDQKIQKKWLKNVDGYITKADKNWDKIKDVPAGKL